MFATWGGGARRKAAVRREVGDRQQGSKQWEGLTWKTHRSRLTWKTTSPAGSPCMSLQPDCFLLWFPKKARYFKTVLLDISAGQRHQDLLGGPTPDLQNQNRYINKTSRDAYYSWEALVSSRGYGARHQNPKKTCSNPVLPWPRGMCPRASLLKPHFFFSHVE